MLIVSVGTGTAPNVQTGLDPDDMNLLYNASTIPSALMFAAQNEQDLLCRVFGKCIEGEAIGMEIGDLMGSAVPMSADGRTLHLRALRCGTVPATVSTSWVATAVRAQYSAQARFRRWHQRSVAGRYESGGEVTRGDISPGLRAT